jgi:hypothetical protein
MSRFDGRIRKGPEVTQMVVTMVEGEVEPARVPDLLEAFPAKSAAETWQNIVEQRRLGIRRIVESVAAQDQLREGLSMDDAADIVYGLHRPETLAVFVFERGWPLEDYKEWSYNLLCHQLLSSQGDRQQALSPTRGLTFNRESSSPRQ